MKGRSSRYVIDGSFLTRGHPSGLDRFALEVIRALDDSEAGGRFLLLVPPCVEPIRLPALRSMAVVRYGFGRGVLWQQTCYCFYALTRRMTPLGFCNTAPLLSPGVVTLHDIIYRTRPQAFRTCRGRLSRLWHLLQYAVCTRFAERILTVSDFSKDELSRVYGVPPERMSVVYNGWEHLLGIQEDPGVFDRFPSIRRNGYFFVLGSLCEYKNLGLVMRMARRYPDTRWVVTGAKMGSSDVRVEDLENVLFTGYLSDGQMKSMMGNCRALVFPSLCEGFGIPPLEALALGRPAVVARRSCLPGIYGDTVHWIDRPEAADPENPEDMLRQPVSPADDLLRTCSWRRAAERILIALRTMEGGGE